MRNLLKRSLKKFFNFTGIEITRVNRSSGRTLLGLNKLPIKTVIDVGANTGQFARSILEVFPDAQLFCFEPLPEPFKQLSQWAGKCRNKKISLLNIGLGEKEEDMPIFIHSDHSPSSSFLKTTETVESLYPFTRNQISAVVKVSTLDKWFNALSHKPSSDILIKLDVQGYEDRVIRGGGQLFDLAKACILEVDLDDLYKDQATFEIVFNLLKEKGYRYAGNLSQSYASDGHVVYVDAVFVK